MARFWQGRFCQLIDRMSLSGGLRRVAIVILGLALRVPESRLGFQVGAELNFSAVSFFGFSVTQLPLSAPLCRPHSPPSPSLRQLAFLAEAAAGRNGEHRGRCPGRAANPRPKAARRRTQASRCAVPGQVAQHGHLGEESPHGRPVGQSRPRRQLAPGQRNRRGPRPAEALRRRLPVGGATNSKKPSRGGAAWRRASRPRGERCGQ